jgi:hypothetical protein
MRGSQARAQCPRCHRCRVVMLHGRCIPAWCCAPCQELHVQARSHLATGAGRLSPCGHDEGVVHCSSRTHTSIDMIVHGTTSHHFMLPGCVGAMCGTMCGRRPTRRHDDDLRARIGQLLVVVDVARQVCLRAPCMHACDGALHAPLSLRLAPCRRWQVQPFTVPRTTALPGVKAPGTPTRMPFLPAYTS